MRQTVEKLLDLLGTLDQWINETPPVDQPSRFGNKAFRTWYSKLDQVCTHTGSWKSSQQGAINLLVFNSVYFFSWLSHVLAHGFSVCIIFIAVDKTLVFELLAWRQVTQRIPFCRKNLKTKRTSLSQCFSGCSCSTLLKDVLRNLSTVSFSDKPKLP